MTTSEPKAAKAVTPKRKMKPGGGKAKGNSFEATIAKKLSKELQPLNFIRTPGSGARVGGKNFATIGAMFGEDALKIFVGDVVPVNERQTNLKFLHSVECKFYKTQDSFTGLSSGSANVLNWYEEAVVDAAKINKIPMLIFKWNRTDVFVAVDCTAHATLLPTSLPKPQFTILTYNTDRSIARALDIFLLDELLKTPDFWFTKE